jgi:hypothetical protein
MVSRSSRNSNRMLGIGIMLRAEVREEIVRKEGNKVHEEKHTTHNARAHTYQPKISGQRFCGDETVVAA